MELIRAAEILIDKIKRDYKDDVALVVMMGSYIYNDTHTRSDLDMFFVPKTERGRNLGITFILDEIGFDYWPISWERLERIADHEERITSIITEGKIIYCASKEDRERFDKLVNKALNTAGKSKFTQKASVQLGKTYKEYFELLNAQDLFEARVCAISIIYAVTYALALLNRITVKRGRGKLKQEIMDMPLVPDNFSYLYDTVFISADIRTIQDACGKLIKNTKELILHEQEKQCELIPFTEALDGFYEELINYYNKIYHACETGDAYCALFAAAEIIFEITQVFTGTGVSPKQLPDIIGTFAPDKLNRFFEAAKNHQKQFVELLIANGVIIRQFGSFDELEEYLYPI